jgi:CRP-like cAMP-binding protein
MFSHAIPASNSFLDSLPLKQRTRVLNLCTSVDLDFGAVVCEANEPYTFIHFPITGFISSIAMAVDHSPLEMGLIGNEGVLGASVALGVINAPFQSIVQGAGTALRIPVAQFKRELLENPTLVALLNRYIYLSMQQLSQTAVCIHYHEIEARLARWLLMTNDRAHGDAFLLTHSFMAQMLGVRRSGVSVAASALQKKSLISYARGNIKVLDRKGLEAASCSCYGVMREFYSKMFS